ncbi:RloB family protein [Bifidobacterium vespertilionis]|uniref:RloB domain-containing protein n=1 Tax=Bifidobacterium vespertilionis TaxID=2562524 RepID=A0A5J5DVZ4_9BIFI|nr:RloB family protein [Bifidobacterium vespertilionis]KAA8821017.1 RloB domain-containing protein [Bifidobacterium vespertilionis]KAA8821179.1 RloB domain-containing protein [Bifidobacterium vespertilionis]
MSRRKREPRPLRRPAPDREERRVIRIFTEGEVTEVEYVDLLRHSADVSGKFVLMVSGRHGQPWPLVQAAIKDKERNEEVDEYWCWFDVEWPRNNPGQHHPRLADAMRSARDNGIKVAVSNPLFELWLILHAKDQTGSLNNEDAERIRHGIDHSDGKELGDGFDYGAHYADAVRRARKLSDRHADNGTDSPNDNPSSGMYAFLEELGIK